MNNAAMYITLRDRLLVGIRTGQWLVPMIVVGCGSSARAVAPPASAPPVANVTPTAPIEAPPALALAVADTGPGSTPATDATEPASDDEITTGPDGAECMTLAQVEANIRAPVGLRPPSATPDPPDARITARRLRNGCYVPSAVHDGCCHPARSARRWWRATGLRSGAGPGGDARALGR